LFDEVERARGGERKINDAARSLWSVVVDGDADGFSVAEVGNAEFGAAGKVAVGGGEFFGGVGAAAGGFVAFERGIVEGGVAALGFGFFGGWFFG